MNKQDRPGVRTPADLERKYDFRSFEEAVKKCSRLEEEVEKLKERIKKLEE